MCDDGTVCTPASTCVSGVCKGSSTINCDDNLSCTTDSCDPIAGCLHAKQTGTTCELDGLPCTLDRCDAGVCAAGVVDPLYCFIEGACQALDEPAPGADGPCALCDPFASQTAWTPTGNGSACGPNCVTNGQCSNGTCAGAKIVCAADDGCLSAACIIGTGCVKPAICDCEPQWISVTFDVDGTEKAVCAPDLPVWGAMTDSPGDGKYTANGDGTVTDTLVGRVWQNTASSKQTYTQAIGYCNSLELGGFRDWRLPTLTELFSLMDFLKSPPKIATAFTNVPGGVFEYFWTATAHPEQLLARMLTFHDGTSYPKELDNPYYVKCVRGGPTNRVISTPPSRFVIDEAAGVVRDLVTKLEWIRFPDPTLRTHEEAIFYCATHGFGGGGWHLPRLRELRTLVDFEFAKTGPAINRVVFEGNHYSHYHTDTVHPNLSPMIVDFYNTSGSQFGMQVSAPGLARCVRAF